MRKHLPLTVLAAAALAAGVTAASAASTKATVKLHPPMHTHMMSIMHAIGSARIAYTAHDATINLTTDGLPQPSHLKENAYVLWLVNGNHKLNAGSLRLNGMMAGLHAMTMDVAFNQLVVTAEKSASGKIPMGPKVLVGTVMHH